MITVFYDGKCGLCAREINHYRKIAPPDRFNWADVASHPQMLEGYAVSQADALRYLHAVDGSGRVHKGVAAFALIWNEINGWRRFAPMLAWPGVRHVAEAVYALFAHIRFRSYRHCRLAATAPKTGED